MSKLAGFCCVLFSLFVCCRVCVSCLADSLIDPLCVLIPALPESLVVLFPPFSELTTFSHSFSSCLSPSHSHAGSFTSTSTLISSPSPTVLSLCPLHGFVLLPQCQGPGDEVTLHGRAAGLTEPRPSPPPSSAQRTKRPTASPPPAHHVFA